MPIDVMHPYGQVLSRMSRRQLLNIGWKLGAMATLPITTRTAWAQPVFRVYPFSLGVASGDPWPDGVVLWTRLAPEPLDGGGMPMANVEVSWQVATDRTFRTIVKSGTAIARPELGHSVHVEAMGLSPGREYFYRFRCGGETSQVGRTKTAPAAGAAVDRLRFGVCGCGHYETGYFSAYGRLAEEQFDFVFHTGDYIYEGRGDRYRNPANVRHHQGQEIYTLVDYRNRYAQYKLDPDLMAAHLSAPFVMAWDDHEVDNDYAGDQDERETPPEVFLLRRAAAYQAYYESMPVRPSMLPRGPDMTLYRHLAFGNLIDLSVLDTRQYRSKQATCGDPKACPELLDVRRTILGAAQEKWLFEGIATARATWTVIGQQVPTFARDMASINPAARFSVDKWDGYAESRNRLFAHLRDSKAANPIVISGDVHNHWCADLKEDFTNPKSATLGVEFTNTSVTSGGDGSEVQPTYEALHRDNPHITYHSNRRGYIGCTATPTMMKADFRVVDRVTVPNQPARTARTMVVEAGRAGSSTS
ncbi:MAG TPA: alkaline phosphatase D family protein [Vicinamibacterales bacterium]